MLTKTQERLLDILEFFNNFCEKNKLRYYAVGGTLLGAARHKGFIPWDDDLDVAMPRPDYERLIELMKGATGRFRLETPYSQDETYCYTMSKLYDTTTTAIEITKTKCKRGIYMDIFPLDGIGNSLEEAKKNLRSIYYLNMFIATRTSVVRAERSRWKNNLIKLSGLIPKKMIDVKKMIIKLDKKCSTRKYDDYKYVGILVGSYGIKDIIDRTYYEESAIYEFENQAIVGVKQYDGFLTSVYGNWRELPPEDKRKSGHDFYLIDYDRSYLEEE